MSVHVNNATALAGARLLDSRIPGWEGRIDLDKLDIGKDRDCVLAQLFGSYNEGAAQLDIAGKTGRLGFSVLGDTNHKELTQDWVNIITDRLDQRPRIAA